LLEARQRQETEEYKQLYRLRPRVEGKQAELVSHGLRNTRYLGKAKRVCKDSSWRQQSTSTAWENLLKPALNNLKRT